MDVDEELELFGAPADSNVEQQQPQPGYVDDLYWEEEPGADAWGGNDPLDEDAYKNEFDRALARINQSKKSRRVGPMKPREAKRQAEILVGTVGIGDGFGTRKCCATGRNDIRHSCFSLGCHGWLVWRIVRCSGRLPFF
jgi:hypothetical protein